MGYKYNSMFHFFSNIPKNQTLFLPIFLALLTFLPQCDQTPQFQDTQTPQFQTLKFYSMPNQTNQISSKVAYDSLEYYKVFFYLNSKFPLQEVHYKNYQIVKKKIFKYSNLKSSNPTLKSIVSLNKQKQKTQEIFYRNQKPSSSVLYFYHPEKKYLIRKERYQQKNRNGWWEYYNPAGLESKIEYYQNDQLQFYRTFQYDSNQKISSESTFDSNHKPIQKPSLIKPLN